MNYYMLFGGTTFGRQGGGPLIITSYDYDVQINEYVMRAEPKFSLTTKLHTILLEASDVLLSPASLIFLSLFESSARAGKRASARAACRCRQESAS